MHRTLLCLLLLLPSALLATPELELAADDDSQLAQLYRQGKTALDEEAWSRAADAFRRAADAARSSNDQRGAAALYWTAYSHGQQGQRGPALAALDELYGRYPESEWLDDAEVLRLDLEPRVSDAQLERQELKIMALHRLMEVDPEAAVPRLEAALREGETEDLQAQALYILVQSGHPRGNEVLADTARRHPNLEVRRQALHLLGARGSSQDLALLEEIYNSDADIELRQQILHSFMVAGQQDRVLRAAREENEHDLRIAAIHALAHMGAVGELETLFTQLPDTAAGVEDRAEVLYALATTDSALIERVANDAGAAPGVREAAIHGLAMRGGSVELLQRLYREGSTQELRSAILHALFLQRAEAALVDIASNETANDLKMEVIHWLSEINPEKGKQLLLQVVDQ